MERPTLMGLFYLKKEDATMAKFSISGVPENMKLPEDKSEKKNEPQRSQQKNHKQNPPKEMQEIADKFNVSMEDLDEMMEVFKEIVAGDLDPELIEQLGDHLKFEQKANGMKEFGLDLEGLEMVIEYMTDENNDKLDQIMQDLFHNKVGFSIDDFDPDIAKQLISDPALIETFNQLMSNIQTIQGRNIIKPIVSQTNKNKLPSLNKEIDFNQEEKEEITNRKNQLHSFDIVADNESFGVVPYVKANSREELYNSFVKVYGEGPLYSAGMFSQDTEGYNLIPAIGGISQFAFITNNERYIILNAIPKTEAKEGFIVAAIQGEPGIFEIIVPEYGNTYNFETGELLNIVENFELYEEKENPDDLDNPKLELKQPANLDKIMAGLDCVLYEPKTPILSPHDFGEILVSFVAVPFTTQYIKIGRIKSNESQHSKLFKRDFGLDDDQLLFDFYIKLPEEQTAQIISALQKFLEAIDFNTNPKIQTQELKVDSNGNMYIDLDLGESLPRNIRKWKDEK
jgi:hypothetical protein